MDKASNGNKNICPTGFHVPTDTEWTTLTTYLGGESVAGGKMKESGTSHWASPNTGATNESGFNILPAGYRNIDGSFFSKGDTAYFWTNTLNRDEEVWYVSLIYYISRITQNPLFGYSVRFVKN